MAPNVAEQERDRDTRNDDAAVVALKTVRVHLEDGESARSYSSAASGVSTKTGISRVVLVW
jgi:hypothetical protein